MARTHDELSKPTGSVIGKGFTIQAALLTGAESVRVDGVVAGKIELDGALHLSDAGFIEGDIHVSSARIAGHVNGNIYCRAMLHLASTALITGDIETGAVIIDNGAVLRGQCKTRGIEAEAAG